MPENSIVGMLLEHDDDYIIVKSSQTGIMQHDAMSWQVSGTSMVTAKRLSAHSRRLNRHSATGLTALTMKKAEVCGNAFWTVIRHVVQEIFLI